MPAYDLVPLVAASKDTLLASKHERGGAAACQLWQGDVPSIRGRMASFRV